MMSRTVKPMTGASMSSLDRNVGPQQPVGSLLLEATTAAWITGINQALPKKRR